MPGGLLDCTSGSRAYILHLNRQAVIPVRQPPSGSVFSSRPLPTPWSKKHYPSRQAQTPKEERVAENAVRVETGRDAVRHYPVHSSSPRALMANHPRGPDHPFRLRVAASWTVPLQPFAHIEHVLDGLAGSPPMQAEAKH